MPEHLHLIIAKRNGSPIASSLLVVDHSSSKAYGRYWKVVRKVNTKWRVGFCLPAFNLPTGYKTRALLRQSDTFWIVNTKVLVHIYVNELSEHSPLKSSKVS